MATVAQARVAFVWDAKVRREPQRDLTTGVAALVSTGGYLTVGQPYLARGALATWSGSLSWRQLLLALTAACHMRPGSAWP